jgi:hypothetical protein
MLCLKSAQAGILFLFYIGKTCSIMTQYRKTEAQYFYVCTCINMQTVSRGKELYKNEDYYFL